MTSHIFIVYETTNLVNGRKYRGAHKGNVNDGYLGSGKILNQAIQKYGKHNFIREILFCAFDIESMYWAESILVSKEWIEEHNAYNLRPGGSGGFEHIKITHGVDNIQQIPNIHEKSLSTRKINWEKKYGGHPMKTDTVRKRANKNRSDSIKTSYGVTCIAHIPGVSEKRSKTMSKTRWLYHESIKKNIRRNINLVPEYLEQGWVLGKR